MTPEEFKHILKEISPYCKNIFLHVKGEPLLSRHLGEMLKICGREGFLATITTNGTQIATKAHILYEYASVISSFNISLQGFIHSAKWQKELPSVLAFCDRFEKEHGKNIVLRLWGIQEKPELKELIKRLIRHFSLPEEEIIKIEQNRSYTIRKGIHISQENEFVWPGENKKSLGEIGFCYGSLNQLAILCDGRVVPCCLDGEGEITLGNIYAEPFEKIFNSDRLRIMREGFMRGKAKEELCKKCSYKSRFDQKARRIARDYQNAEITIGER
jgi:radical SAM protein with 4Fe4S-binding SPASM domain